VDLATLWIPSVQDHHLRARYRVALSLGGWRVGAWKRTAVTALREGLTHACLPTAAGTFFVPPHPFDLASLTAALSRDLRRVMLTVDDHALTVFARGEVRERFARWGSDPAAVARALEVPTEQVALLIDPETAAAQGDASRAEGEAWELMALRVGRVALRDGDLRRLPRGEGPEG
jgi:hypothetical protein